jgi:transposase
MGIFSSIVASMGYDDSMGENTQGPRAGGSVLFRSLTPVQKLEHVLASEAARTRGQGGTYLRGEGFYASEIAQWRKLRNAGVLMGKATGSKIGGVRAQQAEIARLRGRLETTEAHLARIEVALLDLISLTLPYLEIQVHTLPNSNGLHVRGLTIHSPCKRFLNERFNL